jgi:hypothetical protein
MFLIYSWYQHINTRFNYIYKKLIWSIKIVISKDCKNKHKAAKCVWYYGIFYCWNFNLVVILKGRFKKIYTVKFDTWFEINFLHAK